MFAFVVCQLLCRSVIEQVKIDVVYVVVASAIVDFAQANANRKIVVAVLVVIFAILGVILGKKVRDHTRKKRTNEIDDDNYEYNQPENEDKKLFKNDENNE